MATFFPSERGQDCHYGSSVKQDVPVLIFFRWFFHIQKNSTHLQEKLGLGSELAHFFLQSHQTFFRAFFGSFSDF